MMTRIERLVWKPSARATFSGPALLGTHVTFLPLDRDILLLSIQLPGEIHGDPADRMLIAAAQLHGLPLITIDQRIIEYARVHRGVPVCDARP